MTDSQAGNDFRGSKLVESFYWMIERGIDADGVYPQVGIAKIDGETQLWALALDPEEIVQHVRTVMTTQNVEELVFGLDRYTKPDQGTEFADVITFLWWDGQKWTPGIIDYQHEPRIVRPINWNNEFWNNQMLQVTVPHLRPFFRVTKNTPQA